MPEDNVGTVRSSYEAFHRRDLEEFRAGPLAGVDAAAHEWFTSPEFDTVLVETVRSTFPAHEHEQFIAHYRGLLRAWASDQAAAA